PGPMSFVSPSRSRVNSRVTTPTTDLLAQVIAQLETTRWAALVVDAENRVVWISDELKGFIGEHDPGKLGIGKNLAAALMSETWLRTITPESAFELFTDAMPYLVDPAPGAVAAFSRTVPEPMRSVLASIEPKPMPEVWTGH